MNLTRKVQILLLLSMLFVTGIFIFVRSRNYNSSAQAPLTSNSTAPISLNLDHIFIVVMENKSYDDIVKNDEAPYINSLINLGGLATNYDGVAHPSLPNYLALIGGDTFGITSDCTDCFVKAKNITDEITAAGKTWKAYLEDYTDDCSLGNSGSYAQRHNPFIYFDSIRNDPKKCANLVSFDQLIPDIQNESLPNYVWITPNTCNDMHDCSVATGDKWLSQNLPQIIHSYAFTKQNSLLILTWDESEMTEGNRVATILYGANVKSASVSGAHYNHYSILSLIEKSWGLSSLTKNDKDANPFSDLID